MNIEVDLSSEIRQQFASSEKLRHVNHFLNSNESLRKYAERKGLNHSMLSKWIRQKPRLERQCNKSIRTGNYFN